MGKFSGKLLTLYISPSGVRVCEGSNRHGDPSVSKFFTVSNVSEFFIKGTRQSPTSISNMSGLVKTIVDECKAHSVLARRVLICSDCFAIRTEFSKQSVVGGLKTLMTGDVKNLFSRKNREDSFESDDAETISCKCSWGETIEGGVVKNVVSRTKGNKFMLKSLVQEFYSYGYEVIHISGALETSINYRHTELANFDSQGKIIFDFDIGCCCVVLRKDVPLEVTRLSLPEPDMLWERVETMVKNSLSITGPNPKIYLTGSIFKDCDTYNMVISRLEDEGYSVYDLFNAPTIPEDYDRLLEDGEILPVFTPDYAMNIALLMLPFTKVYPHLTPAISIEDIFKRNSQAVATIILAVSVASVLCTGGLAAKRFYDMQQITRNPSNVSGLSSQISTLNVKKTSLTETIATLTQADTTVLNLLTFIEANKSDRVVVVSVDTRDMLRSDMEVTTTTTQTAPTTSSSESDGSGVSTAEPSTDSTLAGEVGGPGFVRENIVVRGYAKSGNEAVSYYNRLFNSGIAQDPVLNGVERYTLPDGEEVYVFEIELGEEAL